MNIKINQPAQQHGLKTGTSRNTKKILYTFAIYMLLIAGMTACKSNDKPQQAAQQNRDSLTVVQDTLQNQFNAARMQVDQLTTEKTQLDSLVRLKDREIAKLKGQVGKLNKNNRLLAARIKKDKEFIASLQADLSDKARAYAERLGLLQSDRDNLAAQNDSFVRKYNALRELGSVLDASNFRMEALHLKHHGRKEKLTRRARKADILRVKFDIDENRIADNGMKKIYLVMKDPDGKLLSNNDNSSGTVTATNGTTISYSVVKEVMLHTNEPIKDVTVDWKQGGDYEKGDYTIGLYNGGYRIGGGKVTLN